MLLRYILASRKKCRSEKNTILMRLNATCSDVMLDKLMPAATKPTPV